MNTQRHAAKPENRNRERVHWFRVGLYSISVPKTESFWKSLQLSVKVSALHVSNGSSEKFAQREITCLTFFGTMNWSWHPFPFLACHKHALRLSTSRGETFPKKRDFLTTFSILIFLASNKGHITFYCCCQLLISCQQWQFIPVPNQAKCHFVWDSEASSTNGLITVSNVCVATLVKAVLTQTYQSMRMHAWGDARLLAPEHLMILLGQTVFSQ